MPDAETLEERVERLLREREQAPTVTMRTAALLAIVDDAPTLLRELLDALWEARSEALEEAADTLEREGRGAGVAARIRDLTPHANRMRRERLAMADVVEAARQYNDPGVPCSFIDALTCERVLRTPLCRRCALRSALSRLDAVRAREGTK